MYHSFIHSYFRRSSAGANNATITFPDATTLVLAAQGEWALIMYHGRATDTGRGEGYTLITRGTV